jgi:hypothetical protein
MFAAVVSVDIAEGKNAEARELLHSQIVPRVKGMAGFVAGYWTAVSPGKGLSFLVFDSDEHARQGVPKVGAPTVPGGPVTVSSVEFVEVVASA